MAPTSPPFPRCANSLDCAYIPPGDIIKIRQRNITQSGVLIFKGNGTTGWGKIVLEEGGCIRFSNTTLIVGKKIKKGKKISYTFSEINEEIRGNKDKVLLIEGSRCWDGSYGVQSKGLEECREYEVSESDSDFGLLMSISVSDVCGSFPWRVIAIIVSVVVAIIVVVLTVILITFARKRRIKKRTAHLASRTL